MANLNPKLFFFVLLFDQIVHVDADSNWTIGDLLVDLYSKQGISNGLSKTHPSECNFYVLKKPVMINAEDLPLVVSQIKASVHGHEEDYRKVSYVKFLDTIVPNFLRDHLYLVVKEASPSHEPHPTEENNVVNELAEAFDNTLKKALLGTPSYHSKSGGYRTFQRKGEPIYDGRYDSDRNIEYRAPSIQLYNPVFGHFLDDIGNETLEVPTEVIQATARLMDRASAIYETEAARKSAILPDLQKAISLPLAKVSNGDSASPDGMTMVMLLGDIRENAATSIWEEKNEFGDGASDPSTQGGLSYGRHWAQKEHAEVLANSCCPTFILAHAGPWFAVLGAVFTYRIIVQRLTDYIWIGNDTVFNELSIRRNARMFHALGNNIRRLGDYYQSLRKVSVSKGLSHPRCFPSIHAYPDTQSQSSKHVNFTYIRPLESDPTCTTFLAKVEQTTNLDPNLIVVKFVDRYNPEAHKLLAAQNMAPKLLYYGKIGFQDGDPTYGHLRMVVMDYVDGVTADKAHKLGELPTGIYARVKEILAVLHGKNYVFGDLRGPNVMVAKNGDIMFIDFDWAGKDGESTYPIMMSQTIPWPKGVKDGLAVMRKEHDHDMLKRLFPLK